MARAVCVRAGVAPQQPATALAASQTAERRRSHALPAHSDFLETHSPPRHPLRMVGAESDEPHEDEEEVPSSADIEDTPLHDGVGTA
jgi:hypothetical protein